MSFEEKSMIQITIEYITKDMGIININFSIEEKDFLRLMLEYLKLNESLKNDILSNYRSIKVKRL